ncbi:hypothetical protein BIW11_03677 [Tropilaelaps mercedesae]|uniref:Uncharacterized protein n=1 Tax=Tropilaelaps mercedesae TaxID=418985 RepID=A0A1V9XHW2_9ACAR|nr:hypothetical protein BIW11_03677 [Tropilaelaps mercedesae]
MRLAAVAQTDQPSLAFPRCVSLSIHPPEFERVTPLRCSGDPLAVALALRRADRSRAQIWTETVAVARRASVWFFAAGLVASGHRSSPAVTKKSRKRPCPGCCENDRIETKQQTNFSAAAVRRYGDAVKAHTHSLSHLHTYKHAVVKRRVRIGGQVIDSLEPVACGQRLGPGDLGWPPGAEREDSTGVDSGNSVSCTSGVSCLQRFGDVSIPSHVETEMKLYQRFWIK